MIYALEGPDCSGKSSLYAEVHRQLLSMEIGWVPSLSCSEELLPVMPAVMRRHAQLWEALYDPRRLYVCDRHFAVSGPVYDAYYRRSALDVSEWYSRVRVLYVDVPLDELYRRQEATGHSPFDFKRLKLLYSSHLQNFNRTVVLPGTEPLGELVKQVCVKVRAALCSKS